MRVRIWKKTETQAFIRDLRKSGYHVQRVSTGYHCYFPLGNGEVDCVFTALEGARNYIVRLNEKYLENV